MTMILNLIKEHYEDLCANKFDNVDEMGRGTQAKLLRQRRNRSLESIAIT